ncbi:hypothetical protein K469DRAFT_201078 [Zopfia rhizophila CBS 207.26]|uniref:Uncharacterized protein n=1 Tax=Zopfia rhizophila CBS 207.26 TaxID=1314779 RepID=A0A6A6DVS0_9PEZI|nr:hypothetical protein K469DRAFT_201078 [Zopfia rhizophila CBS 207.26]
MPWRAPTYFWASCNSPVAYISPIRISETYVRIIEARAPPSGLDLYGQLLPNVVYIKLIGTLIPATLSYDPATIFSKDGRVNRRKYEVKLLYPYDLTGDNVRRALNGGPTEGLDADYEPAVEGPDHLPPVSTVDLLKVADMDRPDIVYLALIPVKDEKARPETYKRIGILELHELKWRWTHRKT